MPYNLDDRELGVIEVRERRGSSRFSARWKEGGLVVITPVGVSRNETLKAIDAMRARLLARRPAAMFEIGHPLQLDGEITYHFESSQLHPDKIMLHPSDNGGVVSIGSNLQLGTPATDAAIRLEDSQRAPHPRHLLRTRDNITILTADIPASGTA